MTESRVDPMGVAFAEAEAAFARGEVPIGAAIVRDGVLVASAGNRTLELDDPTAHAEILAIRAAAAAVGSQRLVGVDLHVTLEPCAMCAAAISFARIRRLYYGADDEKGGADKVLYFSNPPRIGASRQEHFQVGLQRGTLEKFNLSTDTTAKDSIATYREGRLFEREFSSGVTDFHRAEVQESTQSRESIRAELKNKIMTNPVIAQLPGQVVGENDLIKPKMDAVADKAVKTANQTIEDAEGVPVTLYLTPQDRADLEPFFRRPWVAWRGFRNG